MTGGGMGAFWRFASNYEDKASQFAPIPPLIATSKGCARPAGSHLEASEKFALDHTGSTCYFSMLI